MSYQEEIMALAKNGIVTAEAVVEFAKDPSTALHQRFEWDDTKAAFAHRLQTARHLIVTVQIVPRKSAEPIQAFVSLNRDRVQPNGGYRLMTSVIRNKKLYSEFLAQARAEYLLFKRKYETISELEKLFEVGDEVFKAKTTKQLQTA